MLKLIVGTTGCGKTTYTKSLGLPFLSFDTLWNYTTKVMDYKRLRDFAKKHQLFVLDGILLNRDPKLNLLIDAIRPHTIDVVLVYTSLEHLYDCQRSTQARRDRRAKTGLTKEEETNLNRCVLLNVNKIMQSLLSENVIESITYIYRAGGIYSCFDSDSHFLKIVGE